MSERQWRILLVEDEHDGREVVVDTLAHFDILCDAAATAEDAIRLLETHTYTAAIIDLSLPGMDGLDLLNYIRNQPQSAALPCVAYTAYHTSKVRQEVIDAGFDAYFEKPARQSLLLQTLENIIHKR